MATIDTHSIESCLLFQCYVKGISIADHNFPFNPMFSIVKRALWLLMCSIVLPAC